MNKYNYKRIKNFIINLILNRLKYSAVDNKLARLLGTTDKNTLRP